MGCHLYSFQLKKYHLMENEVSHLKNVKLQKQFLLAQCVQRNISISNWPLLAITQQHKSQSNYDCSFFV